jgi:hypothetical protein
MTLIGIWADRDRAFCWADTEGALRHRDTRRYGRSSGQGFKLAVNEIARLAAAGAGNAVSNAYIAQTVSEARSFDDFCSQIPDLLRENAIASNRRADWICAAAGYSRRFGRMMGAVCKADSDFALSFSYGFTAPRVAQGWAVSVTGPLDLLPIAKQQQQIIAEWGYPFAGGNKLIVADLNRDGVSCVAFDLAVGFQLAKVPELPPMTDWRRHLADLAECGGGGE